MNDIISVANISRGLINQNILKIKDIIGTISNLNETIGNTEQQLIPLFTTRRFIFLHIEFLIHHSRVQELIKQLQNDITLIRQCLDVHSTGKLTPVLVDPNHLRMELIKINKQLPTSLSLPEDPTTNIWHYYKFLTVTPIIQDDKLIMMIRIPLIDLDSSMTLFKIYNLPIFNHDIGKSLKYRLEGNNLAVTKDQKYFAILSESNFIRCTLAAGHFCNIDNALYHVDSSTWCLPAMYCKDDKLINKYCSLEISNITGPTANYLDQGSWAVSVEKPTQMETLNPPLTFITLQPACSAFSPEIKLPPYFKQYSKGFEIAIKTAKSNVPTFNTSNFRIWQPFNLSKMNDVEKKELKKLEPAPAIPMQQLRAQISRFRHIETKTDQYWIYYVGGGSGSGLLLLLVIGGLVYWCCKRPRYDLARPPVSVTYTAPESQSMMQTREAAIGADKYSALGQKTAGFQEPVGHRHMVNDNDMQQAFATALLNQLEDMGADVTGQHRRLMARQAAGPPLEILP